MKNKSLILGLVSTVFACNLVFTSCSEPKEVEKITILEKRAFTAEDTVVDRYARVEGEAHNGKFLARTDSVFQYAMETKYFVNDTNINKDHRLGINIWVRTNKVDPVYAFVISTHSGDSMLAWNEIEIKKKVSEANKWINIVDSVTIPGNILNKQGIYFKTFLYNTSGATKGVIFDGDDLEITYKTVKKVIEE